MEIAAIGSDEFITGFQLAGIKNAIEAQGLKLNEELNRILDEKKFGILIMEETDFNGLNRLLKARIEKSLIPIVITLTKEAKESNIRELVKKSLGIDLWKE